METLEFPQFAQSYCTVHIALFRSTSNASELLQNLKTKGTEAFPIQLALIDAAYITSREHLLIAIHQALLSSSRGAAAAEKVKQDGGMQAEAPVRGLKTKSIHSEVLWNLSISSNIMDSFRTFGVSEKTRDIIAVHIVEKDSAQPDQILSLMCGEIKGSLEEAGLGVLDSWKNVDEQDNGTVDWNLVRKAYKLDGYTDCRQVENLVSSMVAMKSVAA